MKTTTPLFYFLILSLSLAGCSTWFDKDNTPPPSRLVNFTPEIYPVQQWQTRANAGTNSDHLKLVPAANHQGVFTASKDGTVTASNLTNGKTLWKSQSGIEITAGPALNSNQVFVAGRNGYVVALDQQNGFFLWKTKVASEVLATPTANDRMVLIKSVDGQVVALSTTDGQPLWHYQQTEPTLILRAASTPVMTDNTAVIGFANGNLTKLALSDGDLIWQQAITTPKGSFTIQRMIDIDAAPLINNGNIFAATYQGRIVSLDSYSGKIHWAHDISSYSGMTADTANVYISDAEGTLWAFNARSGEVLWRQTQLAARNLTAPVLMDNRIVIGDAEGYLHWLSKQDGHFIARTKVNSSGILAAPIVNDGTLYVVTRNGHLAAYTV